MAAFASAVDAVLAAVDVQVAIASGDWPIDGGFSPEVLCPAHMAQPWFDKADMRWDEGLVPKRERRFIPLKMRIDRPGQGAVASLVRNERER
jgi:hypothetical protein